MTNTYNTGNPIGSTDPRDLYDNASNFDEGMNTNSPTFTDRLGVLRKSWSGMEAEFDAAQAGRQTEFDAFLAASGYVSLGNYAAGINFTAYNQYVAFGGFFYRPASSTVPFTTTGTWVGGDEGLFVLMSEDAALRQDLATSTGAELVGFGVGATVAEALTDLNGAAGRWVHVQNAPFNAVGDGVSDDAVAIQAAINFAAAAGIREVRLGKIHKIGATLFVPAGVYVVGQGRGENRACRVIPDAAGVYTGGFIFSVNSLDTVNATEPFPNSDAGGVHHVQIWNGDTAAVPIISPLRGCIGFGSCSFKSIRGRNMTQMVRRPGGGAYSDNFEVSDVYCEPVIGAEWQVDIRGLGDGLHISRLHFPYNAVNPGTGTPLGLSIAGTYGGDVTNCVGGDVKIAQSKVLVKNCHYERARVEVDGANVDFLSCYLSAKDRVPMVLLNTTGHACTVSLRDSEFVHLSGLLDWTGRDVIVASTVNLEVSNSYRRFTRNGALDRSQLSGLLLQNDLGTALATWNRYSFELSRSGRVFRTSIVRTELSLAPTSASFVGLSSIAAESNETWGGVTGTYYYVAQYIIDTGRLVGRNQTAGEQSLALTNGGNGARLGVAFTGKPGNCTLRVYRGTSAGSYDAFVDIPTYAMTLLYDNGATLNGYPWVARGAGAVDTLNALGESHYRLLGSRAVLDAAAAPTVGTWAVGDEIYRTAPAAAGKRAWVCTTAGTPGTWKPWGAIDA